MKEYRADSDRKRQGTEADSPTSRQRSPAILGSTEPTETGRRATMKHHTPKQPSKRRFESIRHHVIASRYGEAGPRIHELDPSDTLVHDIPIRELIPVWELNCVSLRASRGSCLRERVSQAGRSQQPGR